MNRWWWTEMLVAVIRWRQSSFWHDNVKHPIHPAYAFLCLRTGDSWGRRQNVFRLSVHPLCSILRYLNISTLRKFLQICHKCVLELKVKLHRFLWSKIKVTVTLYMFYSIESQKHLEGDRHAWKLQLHIQLQCSNSQFVVPSLSQSWSISLHMSIWTLKRLLLYVQFHEKTTTFI